LATEKQSEQLLKPWFDSNRRKALYEWLLEFLAQTDSLSDLDDVSVEGASVGQALIFDGDNWTNEFLHPVTGVSTPTYTYTPATGPERVLYCTGTEVTVTIDPEGGVADPHSKVIILNDTDDGVTIEAGVGVTIEAQSKYTNGESGNFTLSSVGKFAILHRVSADNWILIGDLDIYPERVDNTIVRNDGINGETQDSGVIIDDGDMLYGYKAKTNVQTGTSYNLLSTDTGKVVTLSNGSAITLTLDNSLDVGFVCTVIQKGAGQVTFSPEAGATLRNRSSHTKTAGQYAVTTLYVDENSDGESAVFFLAGDTAA
jgi:hypothetical protein